MTRWDEVKPDAQTYADRFARLAASGADMHGEASLCAALVAPPGPVLDAGCGTGRVAIELARRGFRCAGVDVDRGMVDVAARASTEVAWVCRDLCELGADDLPAGFGARSGTGFALIVAAGNVVPLLSPGTEAEAIRRLAALLVPDGLFVAGFGLDAAHLPIAEAPFGLEQYDDWCAEAGLVLRSRWATWDRQSFAPGGGYAVSVHEPS